MARKKLSESEYFTKLEAANGTHIALFLMCGMFDVPMEPSVCPEKYVLFKGDRWKEYLRLLKESGKSVDSRGNERGFLDGVHDIRKLFGKEMSETDFARCIAAEKARADNTPGTEAQRELWGSGELAKGLPFTDEVYNDLDAQYELWLERYRGYNAPQLESTIITICKRNYVADFLFREGMYAEAQKVQKMVDDLMASEQMRKKDEKPVENLKLDSLVVALEKAGVMENKQFLTLEETQKALFKNFIKTKKYGYSLDVLDKTIYALINALRGNEDLQQIFTLPTELDIEDEHGEMEAEPTEEEEKRVRFTNIPKVQFSDGDE